MIPLSPETTVRLDALFTGEEKELARLLIEQECADNLPLWKPPTERGLERIRFAVLKLSAGDLAQLELWINDAKRDWRDTLVSAGFAHDPLSHNHWRPGTKS